MRSTLVFDLDGTLIDSAPDLAAALNALLAELELAPLSLETVRHLVGEGAVRMIERGLEVHGRAVGSDRMEELRQRFLALYAQCLTVDTVPFPGVVEALRALQAPDRRLAVCTNKPEGMSRVILDALGLSDCFGAVIGGDTLAERKPHPLPLRTAVERAGGDPDHAVMIGDSQTDVSAARAASVPVIVVSYGYTRIPPPDLGADVLIDSFGDIHQALDRIGHG